MRVKEFAGAFSGSTYASLSNITAMAMQDQEIYKVLTNPYSLNPAGERSGPDQPGLRTVAYDDSAKSWMYPFVMENINTKIVRRSHALAGYPYGKAF
ncbi:MAG: saccharopine dehydrogenase, partial [Bacteroidota bacterium]